MSFFISNKQAGRDGTERCAVPFLLPAAPLEMQRLTIPGSDEFGRILQDMFQIHNPGSEDDYYYFLPSGAMMMIYLLCPHQSAAVLCGALTTMRRLCIPAGSSAFCVRLKAGCGDWLCGSGVYTLADRSAPLAQYHPAAEKLLQELMGTDSFRERGLAFFRFLSAQDAGAYQPMALLRRCVELIHSQYGVTRVAELAQTIGCSERYLNRIFQERVGVSTKLYSEMVQLQASLNGILTTHPKSLLSIAVTYGYFDQTHMNRSYRKFLGCTASDMRYADYRSIHTDEIHMDF